MDSFLGNMWFLGLVCCVSFVAGMFFKDTVLGWIGRG